jgi:hypothetical protein
MSRFHLDTLNLKDYLKSMIKGDAPEMKHNECIWNCAIEISERVDNYLQEAIDEASSSQTEGGC